MFFRYSLYLGFIQFELSVQTGDQMVSWIHGGLFGEFARTIDIGLDCLKS